MIPTRVATEPLAKMALTAISANAGTGSAASIARFPSTTAPASLNSVRTEDSAEVFLKRPRPLVIAPMATQATFVRRTSTNAPTSLACTPELVSIPRAASLVNAKAVGQDKGVKKTPTCVKWVTPVRMVQLVSLMSSLDTNASACLDTPATTVVSTSTNVPVAPASTEALVPTASTVILASVRRNLMVPPVSVPKGTRGKIALRKSTLVRLRLANTGQLASICR